jgi:predicted nucleotidyltransferase
MIRFKQIPKNIHQKINTLVGFFKEDPNIIFAYLFGGLLKDRVNPLSDVDIAVFLKDVKKSSYLDLFCKITDILCSDEVDLIILNLSPLSLTGRILQNRKILIDKDPFLRHKYESLTLRKYFDFSMKERDILKRRYGIG